MRKALYPVWNKLIDVGTYLEECGNDREGFENMVLCPYCLAQLNVIAASSLKTGHFAHQRNSGFCRLKGLHEKPYLLLPATNHDPAAGIRLKSAFLENWQGHYSKLRTLIEGFSYNEFFRILEIAECRRIWDYVGLAPFHLPYVFATLVDFPQNAGFAIGGNPVRKWWIRCWFDSSVRGYDDLWIRPPAPVRFFRACYDLPDGKNRPGAEDLLRCDVWDVSDRLFAEERNLNPFVVREVDAWLGSHFKF